MRKLLIAALALGAIAPATSRAFEICTIPLADANVDLPHSTDETNDWEGVVFGNGVATVPAGDVYREGTDLEAAWLSYAEDGTLQANVKVVDLGLGVLVNANFYVLWTYGDGEDSMRWASARFTGLETVYAYGYQTINEVTGNGLFLTVGDTTGTVSLDHEIITIDLPAGTEWGSPEAGATITGIGAESRILVGSPERLPENPANLRHGFVYVADVSEEFCLGTA